MKHANAAAARRSDVVIRNDTDRVMIFVKGVLAHGNLTQNPPDRILPADHGEFIAESNGVATGTEGWINYRLEGVNGDIVFHWDNPFVGRNSADASAPQAFDVDWVGDSGNHTVVFFSVAPRGTTGAQCNQKWVLNHLGTSPEDRLNPSEKDMASIGTPLKRLGFGGWVSTACVGDADGWIVRNAQHSTDGFTTVDVKLHSINIDGTGLTPGCGAAAGSGDRYVRIEIEPGTPAHNAPADNGFLDTNQFISFHGGILIDTHWGEKLIEFHPWDPIVILLDPGTGCTPPPVPEFGTLPACNPPRLSPNYRPTDSDWLGTWGDTGLDTDRDHIVVRISKGASPDRFTVTTRERVTLRGIPSDVTAESSSPGTPYIRPQPDVGVTTSVMSEYRADVYAPDPSTGRTPTRVPTNSGAVNAPNPLSVTAGGPTRNPITLRPYKTLVLSNHVTLQIALGCLSTKPSRGIYLRYFRTANDGSMLTDVILIHSQDPPR